MKNILTRISRLNVMSHNRPSWVAEEPGKTGRSAVQSFGITRQNDTLRLVSTTITQTLEIQGDS
jgi:phage terminase large subunit-like protein